ncbi:hypothetical protein [Paraburkholderia sp.]|nr:hypothetical protein [Paraburkholderia sp.]
MLEPDFAAPRYFFNYRFPDVARRLIDSIQRTPMRVQKKAQCAQALAV